MTRQKFLIFSIRLVTHKASPFSVLFLDEERLKIFKKIIDKLKIVWYNLITRLKETTKKGKELKKMKKLIISIVGKIAVWFESALFIWWGWNIFAEHFNYPQFSYMEVFAMRMAVSWIFYILWQKGTDKGDA